MSGNNEGGSKEEVVELEDEEASPEELELELDEDDELPELEELEDEELPELEELEEDEEGNTISPSYEHIPISSIGDTRRNATEISGNKGSVQ